MYKILNMYIKNKTLSKIINCTMIKFQVEMYQHNILKKLSGKFNIYRFKIC